MKHKTLHIIGNGRTFNPDNLILLKNKHTFGINSGVYGFLEYNFTPTYYGFFEFEKNSYKICDTNVVNTFLKNNKLKKIFCLKQTSDLKHNRIQQINYISSNYKYNATDNTLIPPLNIHIEIVCNTISNKPEDYKQRVNEIIDNTQLWGLNTSGLKKYLTNNKTQITHNDYITTPRIPPPYILPQSFDEFYWQPTYNSCIMALLIGYLLGYNRFILHGVDTNFIIKNNKLNTKDNYWFPAPDIELGTLQQPIHRTYNNIHTDAWWQLQHALMINNIPNEIINCSFGSPLCNIFKTKNINEVIK